ncbi:MAG: tRNA 4-thiouridine(8) synthase ThiI [Lachnospiraceae bacterium]|nr:tRNA 4-thiouridine(8) synthase ThiI [Lachnospiraceae bacterium]
MKEIILLKIGEIALKGLNRKNFEDLLIKNIKRKLYKYGRFEIVSSQSTIRVMPLSDDIDLDEVCTAISKIFGIVTFSRACVADKDLDKIKQAAAEYLEDILLDAKSFKVESKRSDKKFPYGSPEISREVGGFLADKFPHLAVDVHNPEVTVTVEVRDFAAYIHGSVMEGAGGLPVSCGGKAAILISGGIDSPVAAYMMAKRGVELVAIHFASPPYTSQRAEDKVRDLLTIVSDYSGQMDMYTVPFTKIQEEIQKNCPEELFTIIMRRLMMNIAQRIAKQQGCQALITGESLGQVASQTIGAIACTDEVANMPVFRPLIGMDKKEIIEISRKINTFETSCLPYEDCCTVFTPKHPRTRPKVEFVRQAEECVEWADMIAEAVENVKITHIE